MILLDTHYVVWAVAGDSHRIPNELREQIDVAIERGEAAVSAATFWELVLLRRKALHGLAQLPAVRALRSALLARGLIEFPVTGSLWIDAARLVDEGFHRDPVDQLVVATSTAHGCTLLTSDRDIRAWARRSGRVELYDAGSAA